MEKHESLNRRGFLATAGMGVAALSGIEAAAQTAQTVEGGAKDPWRGLKMGVTSFSFRKFPLDEAIRMTRELGVRYISLKDVHLKLNSSKDERQAVARKIEQAGLTLMGGGVIYFKNDEKEVRNAFEYARDAGMPVIIIGPDADALPLLDRMVKEFDIRAAIHNHGPGDKRFPSPMDAYRLAKQYDRRIGLCVDIGHTVRNGEKEVEVIHTVKDRLHDFHIKDVTARSKEGKTVEVGQGVIDIPGVVKALLDIKYQGHVALEFEKDADNPMPGMKESFAYMRKVMAQL